MVENLKQSNMNRIIDKLNDKQRQAVLKTEGPLLILAGAGSGKTRVITNRIAYMIEECGVPARQILAITFTNKAAAEMRERIDDMLGMAAGGAWICTFHSACVRILRMHCSLVGYDTSFTIYDADDQKTLIKNICKKLNIDTKQFKEKWFLSQISSAKDNFVDVDRFEANASGDYYLTKVAKVYREYQSELKKNNAFDFDDLIVKTIELFRNHPEVLEKYQDRFRYISVDEYQDTNTAQFILVKLLAGKYKNICVVGDDDQSIYKFRGANIENILNFEKAFPGAEVIRLEQNYRSTSNILDAANAVIKNNTHRKAKKLWTDAGEGAKITLYYVDNPYVEADRVVACVRKFLSDGFKLNDCACLYRTNAQSRSLEEAFVRANLPYKIVGGVNFYQRKEIKDVLAYLKTIDNASDDISVKRIINVPKRGIGAVAVNMADHLAAERGISFYSALETGVCEGIFGRTGDKFGEFIRMIEGFRKAADELNVKELIEKVVSDSGYLRELELENTVEAQTRIENIQEFVSKAEAYVESFGVKSAAPMNEREENSAEEGAANYGDLGFEQPRADEDEFVMVQDKPTLNGFLEEVSLIADIDSWDAADDYVSLITIHSAKGLEFENVFLCGMEDGLFPMNAAICSEDETDLEEERRLCYVGITRAKKNLILTAARARMVRGETTTSVLSRFVREIPPLLIEKDADNLYVKDRKTEYNGGIKPRVQTRLGDKPYALKEAGLGGLAKPGVRPNGFGGASDQASGGQHVFKSIFDDNFKADDGKKQFEVKSAAGLSYGVGDRVYHLKFGEGTVVAIDEGGRDYEVSVDFDDWGVKKMFAGFARLEKV